MSDPSPITVVLAADANFAMQLGVCLASISANTRGRPHRVFVLHDGYSEDLVAKVKGVVGPDVELRWLDARSHTLKRAQLPEWLSPATLFRLRVEDLLPPDVGRVIYIDTDVVVREPLDELWAVDIAESMLAAVLDARYPFFGPVLPWRELNLSPRTPYFNAGVMVIALDRWRTAHVCQRAIQALESRRLRTGDQCALNIALNGEWAPLGPKWNLQGHHLRGDAGLAWVGEGQATLEAAISAPAIVHYSHSYGRPWDPESRHPFSAEWFRYLDLTPWAGYRPQQRRIPPHVRVYERIRLAGRALLRGNGP